MKAVLLRTGSIPLQSSFLAGSPRVSVSGEKNNLISPRISVQSEIGRRNDTPPARSIRRVSSESNVIRSESEISSRFPKIRSVGSRTFTEKIPEEDYSLEIGGVGSLFLTERGVPVEELEISGSGIGKGRKIGGNEGGGGGGGSDDCGFGAFTGGNADRDKMGEYYEEMLKSNPTDSLLLMNYGKFLHEVVRDEVKAEEYYGRAILANGGGDGDGDGEVFALYGKLIWETQRDKNRAKSYFDRAILASPHDCTVMGWYANFMWEAEEDDDEEEVGRKDETLAAMVAAF